MEVVPPRGIRRLGMSVLGHPLMRWVGVYKTAMANLPVRLLLHSPHTYNIPISIT